MRNMEIIRITSSMVHGTRGVMLIDRQPVCVTLELPWRMNEPFRSCISIGDYFCSRYNSEIYRDTFIVLGAYNRDGILFHPGNYLKDTDGCILPGMSFGKSNDDVLIIESRLAFKLMMERLSGNDGCRLTIRNAF